MLAKARLIVAQTHARQSQWEAAVRAYQRLATLRLREGQPASWQRSNPSSPDGASPDGASPDGASPDGASPYRADALLGAADCYRQLGEVQLAKQAYTTVLLEFPRTESSEQATQQLAILAGGTAT